MNSVNDLDDKQDDPDREWERVDARTLGQILAALNFIFVLPDETRIAEFYSQALNGVPGIVSCFVCLGNQRIPTIGFGEICAECSSLRRNEVERESIMPRGYICRLSEKQDLHSITIQTMDHTFGFIIFRIQSITIFKPYIPFLDNLASYVALYLENKMHKLIVEKSRDGLEDKIKERTEELMTMNVQLEQENRCRRVAEEALNRLNKELEQRVSQRTAELEEKNVQLERMNRIFVGRELRMVELKERIQELEQSVDP
jgi:hypothetical protein